MKITKENSGNNTKSKISDSFCNLTDSPNEESPDHSENSEVSMSKGLMDNLPVDNIIDKVSSRTDYDYEFYFKSDVEIEKKDKSFCESEKKEDELDLEQFYEQKQSSIEEALMRRSSRGSTSKLNSVMKESSLMSYTPRIQTHRQQTIELEKSIQINPIPKSNNKLNNSINNQKSKPVVIKTSLNDDKVSKNKSTHDKGRNTNSSIKNIISYDQFKVNTGKLDDKNLSNCKSINTSNITNNESKNSMKRSNSARPISRSSNSGMKNKIKLKLKITHDTVEDITNCHISKSKGMIMDTPKKGITNNISKINTKSISDSKSSSKSKSKSKSKDYTTYKNLYDKKNINNDKQIITTKSSNSILTEPQNKSNINSFRTNNLNKVSVRNNLSLNKQSIDNDKLNVLSTSSSRNNSILAIQQTPLNKPNSIFDKKLNLFLKSDTNIQKNTNPNQEVKHSIFPLTQSADAYIIKTQDDEISIKDLQIDPSPNENINTYPNLNSEDQTEEDNKNNKFLGKQLCVRTSLLNSDERLSKVLESNSSRENFYTQKMTVQSEALTKGIADDNYTEEIKQIYVKRRATRTNNNSLILDTEEKKRRKLFEEMYNRNLEWKKTVLNKSTQMKEEINYELMKECSFTPKISKSSMKILSKSLNHTSYFVEKDDFYSKNIKWKQQVDKYKQNMLLVNERKKYEECCFTPHVNKSITKLIDASAEKEKKDKHYIYKKNVEWLRKVNENRQLKELEIKEEMKKKSKFTSIRQRMSRSKSNSQMTVRTNLEQFSGSEFNIKDENKLRKELTSFRMSNNLLTSSRNESQNLNFSTINKHIEKDNIDRDIKELKNLITSLKNTLEENKYLYNTNNGNNGNTNFRYNRNHENSDDKFNMNSMNTEHDKDTNRNYISINDSYNININIKSPTGSMIGSFKRSTGSNEKLRSSVRSSRREDTGVKSSGEEYMEKYKKLMEKYEKEKTQSPQ